MNGRSEVTTVTGVETHVSWSAIFAGVVIALISQTMLSLLGLGIGLSTIQPATQTNPLGGLGTGSLIWWVVITIISLFIGGWVASRLSGIQGRAGGVLHGLVTWGLAMLVMVTVLAGAVGTIIGGGLSLVKNAASMYSQSASGGAAGGAQGGGGAGLQQQIQQGQAQIQNMTPQQRQQLEQQARQAAGTVAHGAAAASIGSFFMLLLGGIAAAIGGALGRTRGPVRV